MSDADHKRGRTHNAQGARGAILNAAESVFAEHGFDGARVDAIAALAGYNKSLIFQYFGDKLSLYDAVIRRADEQTRELEGPFFKLLSEDETALDADKLKGALSSYMRRYFEYLVQHPNIMRIFVWEIAEGWQTYAKVVSERDIKDIDEFRPLVRKIQNAGLMRSDFDPVVQLTLVEFIFPCYLACIPLFQLLQLGEDYSSPEALARAREYIIDFVTHGLLADSSEKPPQAIT